MSRPLALVTGASSGIGAAIARRLGADHDLVLSARRADAMEALAAQLPDAKCTVIPVDLARPDGARNLVAEIEKRGLAIDVLVNNAGFGLLGPVVDNDATQLDEMVQVNVAVVTTLCRAFLPGMIARKRGMILNIGSTAAFQPGPGMAGYYATKAYVLSFSEALWYECRGTGVTVTALCPGPVATGFGERSGNGESALFKGGLVPILDADGVAKIGIDAMRAGKRTVIPGLINQLMVWGSRVGPKPIVLMITARMQERVA